MSTPHTPGPWKPIHDRSHHQYAVVTHNDAGPLQMVIARTDNHSKLTSTERQAANARLIAAAPELLAALVRLLAADDESTTLYERLKANEQARAIIAATTTETTHP